MATDWRPQLRPGVAAGGAACGRCSAWCGRKQQQLCPQPEACAAAGPCSSWQRPQLHAARTATCAIALPVDRRPCGCCPSRRRSIQRHRLLCTTTAATATAAHYAAQHRIAGASGIGGQLLLLLLLLLHHLHCHMAAHGGQAARQAAHAGLACVSIHDAAHSACGSQGRGAAQQASEGRGPGGGLADPSGECKRLKKAPCPHLQGRRAVPVAGRARPAGAG